MFKKTKTASEFCSKLSLYQSGLNPFDVPFTYKVICLLLENVSNQLL